MRVELLLLFFCRQMLPNALDLLVARQLFLILHTQIVHQIRIVLRRND